MGAPLSTYAPRASVRSCLQRRMVAAEEMGSSGMGGSRAGGLLPSVAVAIVGAAALDIARRLLGRRVGCGRPPDYY